VSVGDLLGINPGLGDWAESAACREVGDLDLFFPDKGRSAVDARTICKGCSVRAECLDYALNHNQRFGVWGGLSERQRRPLHNTAHDLKTQGIAS
jgi:WhiB family redox-sensing transcriptional regulator